MERQSSAMRPSLGSLLPPMQSLMVIKVKYRDTLRRFSVPSNGKGQLDININGLKEKIRTLFTFPPEADLFLTYVDEDGDIVALVNDDDLCDAVRQRLKFLRIDVKLNNAEYDGSGSSNSYSTQTRSPPLMKTPPPRMKIPPPLMKTPLEGITTAINEILKVVPGPMHDRLSEFVSKAATPVLSEILEKISKISQSEEAESGLKTKTHPTPSKDRSEDVLGKSNFTSKERKVETGNNTPQSFVDLNLPPPTDSSVTESQINASAAKPIADDHHFNGKSVPFVGLPNFAHHTSPFNTSVSQKSGMAGNVTTSKCPFFLAPPVVRQSAVPLSRHAKPFKRGKDCFDPSVGIFHKGVQCDGCGVHPITGLRFKSRIKEDYDLCSICFSAMGNDADFIRIDRPLSCYPQSLQGIYNHMHHSVLHPKVQKHINSFNSPQAKLDSRFILDVNVLDGTVMTPLTPFTKIWRMRNCGDLTWPQGAQLVWIGGDRFSSAVSSDLEIPTNGLPKDGELDIAIDFIAPAFPGRYISYWRMSAPSVGKFGQRVWVLVQVEESLEDAVCDGLQGLNLNMPPATDSSKSQEGSVPAVVGGSASELSNSSVTSSVTPVVVEQQKADNQETNFPINDALLVGNVASAPYLTTEEELPSEVCSPVSYPKIDVPEPTAGPSNATPPVTGEPVELEQPIDESLEELLLKELEFMGFEDSDLNKRTLRKNSYDLEQSVDELCGDNEWDTMLEELQEMGFCDEEANKKLLVKNNGSIKLVVMDLLSGKKV